MIILLILVENCVPIFKIILIATSILYSQVVELTVGQEGKTGLLDAGNVEDYLDSLIRNDKSINHSYILASIKGVEPITVKYIANHELIYIDTLFIKDNKQVRSRTYQSLLKSILNISSEKDILQQIERLESSYKFLQNSIHFRYGKTKGGGLALLLDIIPEFENNISGLFGANRANDGNWITNGEIELYLENIFSKVKMWFI